MICAKCNSVSADNVQFCSHCGAPLGVAAAGAASAGAAAWDGVSRSWPGIWQRAKNILLTPKTEWPVIESESTSVSQLYTAYVIPLAAASAVVSFLRFSVIGISTAFGGAFRMPLFAGLTWALVAFGFGLLGLFLVGLIINWLAPRFGGIKDQRQALKTAAYAFTPAWIGSVLTLLGSLGSLLQLAAGIYGIYLLYLGLPLVMKSRPEKAGSYTTGVVICTLLLGIVLGILSAASGLRSFGAYDGFTSPPVGQEEQQRRVAAQMGNVLGGALGTDEKGKQGLGEAINNLATAGKQMEQQPSAQTGGVAADTAAGSAPASPAAATAGVMTALGGALGGSRPADPVDFHMLKDLLPASLPDLARKDAEGRSQQALGIKGSSASADYEGDAGAHASVKIADAAGVASLLDLASTMAQNSSSESDSGFEKQSTVAGHPVHEKFDYPSKHGEITAVIAKRFVVVVSGDGMEMGALEKDLGAVDLARLEGMKDMGVRASP